MSKPSTPKNRPKANAPDPDDDRQGQLQDLLAKLGNAIWSRYGLLTACCFVLLAFAITKAPTNFIGAVAGFVKSVFEHDKVDGTGQGITQEGSGNSSQQGDDSTIQDGSGNNQQTGKGNLNQNGRVENGNLIQQGPNSTFNEAPEQPTSAFVDVIDENGELIEGDFNLRYQRPNAGPGKEPGSDGVAKITDLPPDTKELRVTHFEHPYYQLPNFEAGVTQTFPIGESREVVIKVVKKYVPLPEPTREEVMDHLEQAGVTKEDVLRETFTPQQKKDWKLYVENHAGKDVVIWLYDCWWCFNMPPTKALEPQSKFTDIRVKKNSKPSPYSIFGRQKSTSGIYALYVEHNRYGELHRQFVGVVNLFDEKNQTLDIGNVDENYLQVTFPNR